MEPTPLTVINPVPSSTAALEQQIRDLKNQIAQGQNQHPASQRGDTIVGVSDGFQDRLPKKGKRGPAKTPLAEKMKTTEAEVSALKDNFIMLQNNMAALMAAVQANMTAQQQAQQAEQNRKGKGSAQPPAHA